MDLSPLHIQRLWGQTADYEVVQKIQPKYKPAKSGGVVHSTWEEVDMR